MLYFWSSFYPLNGELITVTGIIILLNKFYQRGVQSASKLAILNTYMQKLCVAMLELYLRVFQRREVVLVTIIRLVFAVGDIRKPAKHGDCNQKQDHHDTVSTTNHFFHLSTFLLFQLHNKKGRSKPQTLHNTHMTLLIFTVNKSHRNN